MGFLVSDMWQFNKVVGLALAVVGVLLVDFGNILHPLSYLKSSFREAYIYSVYLLIKNKDKIAMELFLIQPQL